MIPIYAVTGFLESGKTTFLNHLLSRKEWWGLNALVIQFEVGEEEFQSVYLNCYTILFSKKMLEHHSREIVQQIAEAIKSREIDEIWIEWNGVVPFSQLQELLLDASLRSLCKIQRVIHIADERNLENLLGRTGSALPEQIANSDFIVVQNLRSAKTKSIRHLLRGINPGVKIYDVKSYENMYRQIYGRKEHPAIIFFLSIVFFVLMHMIGKPALEFIEIPVNAIINIFLGIILQAFPFLLIGVLLSSAIQVFIPQDMIERRFPKSFGMGMFAAIIGGFCLPVCDCASIPIFRSLVKKGVPLPVAVTFMTATPVINPVVILSTYYAFNGNMKIVLGRIFLGVVSAILIGAIFAVWPPKESVLSKDVLGRMMCSCGCYEDVESINTVRGKFSLFLRHAQGEFFGVGKYLIIGTFVSVIFQVMGTGIFTNANKGVDMAVSIGIMMVMAFVLSLCSSSDAVVARSFAQQFPTSAMMGFLVFGPMMDIKNIMMLSSGFSKRFIGKLLWVSFTICFAIVFLFSKVGGM